MNELQLTLMGIGVAVIAVIWIFNRIQEWRWHRMAKSTLGTGRPDVLLGEEPGSPDSGYLDAGSLGTGSLGTGSLDANAHTMHDSGDDSSVKGLSPTHDHENEADQDQLLAKRLDAMMQEESETDAHLASMRLGMVATDPESSVANLDTVKSDDTTQSNAEDFSLSSVRPPRDELTAPPDESIEYLVTLGCTTPITGSELWQNLSRSTSPVRGARWLGRRVTDGGWSVVQPDSEQRFDSLRAALLLANRTGPIGELELERFCSLVSALGTSMNLRVEFPPRAPALDRAIQLDQFCAEMDIVVGMNVVVTGGQTISGGRIARWAETHGMTLGKEGSFHFENPQGYTIWRLSNRDPRPFSPGGVAQMTVSGVTFLLDVPMVEAANERLSPMFDAAATLARELNARVLDDNGQPLGPQQLGRIERELANLLLKMQAEGIPAGEMRARRLFST